ncbi:hypothetical protein [Sporisorium scitamineum]|uniref:Uncharacterized protein n=1 Tax=Sporisorium scitamineum TaxID=49012 RepID=A0A0F7RUQ9_9BASI|nr:hypothetical protein [Sporisorium scitamineum]
MTTPVKRTRSACSYHSPASLDKVKSDQHSSSPSRKIRRSQGKQNVGSAQIWHHDTYIADLEGDTIDPNWIPTTVHSSLATSIGSSRFLLRTGTASDALLAPRLPFVGTVHALSQALNHRYSAQQHHMHKSRFLYRRSLTGHTSCVNALAFSRGQGRWLASAGDDTEIHIRDMFVDLRNEAQTVPLLILKGHESNIFSLDWSAQNQYLFSTGNDSQILYYDVEHSQIPIRGAVPCAPQDRSPLNANLIGAHDDSIPELSAHPSNPNLLLSCDDGGDLKFIDIRMPHDSVAAARSDVVAGFSSVQWNPNASDGNTFAAATCGRITGSTRLYDVRQCFSSDRNRPLSSKDAVLSYHTALVQHSSTRGLIAAAAETNSICFDPEGRLLASSISRYHPTIYSVNDPDPLVTLESTVAEDPVEDQYCHWNRVPVGTPTAPKKLSSCCTIKHGSFGLQSQTGKLHYTIGSDDFRAYVFEIPDRDELLRQREFVNRRQWIDATSKLHILRRQQKAKSEASSQVSNQGASRTADEEQEECGSDHDSDIDVGMVAESRVDHESEVAYCAGSILRASNIVRPARIKKQAFVLCGGRSILNTALIHPTLPLILTAGIVPEINLHSAAPLNPKDIYVEDDWGDKEIETGGTRCRFLLPPPSRSLLIDDDTEDDSVAVQALSVSHQLGIPSSDLASSNGDAHEGTADFQAEHGDADTADPASSSHASSNESKRPYRRTSFNERNLYGSPSSSSRGSEAEVDAQVVAQDADMVDAQESAQREQPQDTDTADARESRHQESRQATVQDFLTAMRNDPMYNTTAPLDYHQDRHIGTYSLSHLSPDLIPADSSPSSASALNEDVDAHTPNTSHTSSTIEEEINTSDLASDHIENYTFRPYSNDGYGSTLADTYDLEERELDDLRNAFQAEDEEYRCSFNGKLWAQMRCMDSLNRVQKQMYLFDELLRRDEMRSLTAGFRKVPYFAGGEGEGREFTCGSCEGRIDTDE